MMTNEGTTLIENFMSPETWVLMLWRGNIGNYSENVLSSSLSIWSRLSAIVMWYYNVAFLCHWTAAVAQS